MPHGLSSKILHPRRCIAGALQAHYRRITGHLKKPLCHWVNRKNLQVNKLNVLTQSHLLWISILFEVHFALKPS